MRGSISGSLACQVGHLLITEYPKAADDQTEREQQHYGRNNGELHGGDPAAPASTVGSNHRSLLREKSSHADRARLIQWKLGVAGTTLMRTVRLRFVSPENPGYRVIVENG